MFLLSTASLGLAVDAELGSDQGLGKSVNSIHLTRGDADVHMKLQTGDILCPCTRPDLVPRYHR